MKRFTWLIAFLLLAIWKGNAQSAFAVKEWDGRYPKMEDDYPFNFVCWKGWLPPIPHFFARIYPTHYYYYAKSYFAYDTQSYVMVSINHILKIVLQHLNKQTIKKYMQAVEGIKQNQQEHEMIEAFLRDSRLWELPDIYQVGHKLYWATQALEELKQKQAPAALRHLLEADLMRCIDELLLINRFDVKQGDKVQAMNALDQSARQLLGTISYTSYKVSCQQHLNRDDASHLTFLGGF